MARQPKTELTPHEKRVLSLLLDGKSNGEIAAATHSTKPAIANAIFKICIFYGVHGERKLFNLLIKSPNLRRSAEFSVQIPHIS
jgi:DNA-binding NarL/FixJ family response regulator